MVVVAELASALVAAGKAVATARDSLQRSQVAAANAVVEKDNLAAEMRRAEAMITAAADRPGVLAGDQLFAVDMEILTLRMHSVRSALAAYELAPAAQRFFCGDVPVEFLAQHAEWIRDLLEKWQGKIEELMAMSPEQVDAHDFARARAIFARPLLLASSSAQENALGIHELRQVVEDMQISVVTGLLYKRGTCQEQVLQDIGFSLTSHCFKTRRYNRGRDKLVAKLSALCKCLHQSPANWQDSVADLCVTLNSLLPRDLPIRDEGEEASEEAESLQETLVLSCVRVLARPPSCVPKEKHSWMPQWWPRCAVN